MSVLLGNGDGTFQPQVTYAVGSTRTPSWRVTSTATAAPTWPSQTSSSGTVSVLLGNGDGTFQPQVTYAVGSDPDASWRATSPATAALDLAVARRRPTTARCRCCWATATARSSPRSPTRWGSAPYAIVAGDFTGDGRTDLAVAIGHLRRRHRVGVAGQRRRHVPAPGHLRGGDGPRRDRGGRLQRRRPHRPGRRKRTTRHDGTVSVLLGNGDGTFQPQVTYAVGSSPDAIVAGDFTGDGRTDLAVANSSDNTVSVLLGNGDGTFQPQVTYAVGSGPTRSWRVTSTATAAPTWPSQTSRTTPCRCCWATATARSPLPDSSSPRLMPRPWWPTSTATAPRMCWSSTAAGNILYRQGIPGQPGTFEPPVTVNPGNPSRDIAWVPNTGQTPVLASVDAHDNAVSLYAYRDGGFVKVGSLATGSLPAQIIAADLNGNGLTDLVVRNAGDGTLSVFFGTAFDRSSFSVPSIPSSFPRNSCLP